MDGLYVVLCSNDKTDEFHCFVAFSRSDAECIKACFLRFVYDVPTWTVNIVRSVDE